MSNLFAKVGGVIASIGLAIGGFFGYVPEPEIAYVPEAVYVPQEEVYAPEEETLGADAVLPVAGVTYYLAGTGISSSATSFTLTSFTVTQNGKKIQDSEMSETFYFTLEPGSRSRQEIVACTTVVQNADNTATISGCSRGMAPVTPYTASTSLQFAHAGGSIAIISNPPQLYNQVAIKDNDETVTGLWDFPTPVSGNNPATKDYVLSVVTGGAITIDSTIIGGVAGETFATGTIVYMNPTDARWYKADADLESTFSDRQLGIAQSSGSAGNSVLAGVLIYGTDDSTQSAMTPGGILWLSATAGATSSATTTQALGTVVDATTLIFNPSVVQSTVGKQTTFTATTTFNSINNFVGSTTGIGRVEYISTTTIWNVPTNAKLVRVQLWGAGGSGSRHGSYGGAGGGGGEYAELFMPVSKLASTSIYVQVGLGGTPITGSSNGVSGGNSSFGTFKTAGGGGGGNVSNITGGGGGGGGVQGSITGEGGGAITSTNYFGSTAGSLAAWFGGLSSGSTAYTIAESFGHIGGGGGIYSTASENVTGVSSIYGGGGGGGGGQDVSNSCNNYPGGSSRYGGGGGGGACTANASPGGTSYWGGNGGAGSVSGTAVSGSFPGGGGGGTVSGTSGAGGNGLVIITTF